MPNYKTKLKTLRRYVDGNADTAYERFILVVIIIDILSLGLEAAKIFSEDFRYIFSLIDQICLIIFMVDLIIKVIAYNKEFFFEKQKIDDVNDSLYVNFWNISDLIIILVSVFATLPSFAVFRIFKGIKIFRGLKSFRIIKSLKFISSLSNLRSIVEAMIKAIPGVTMTFLFLFTFMYVYAIIGNDIFSQAFPQYFGTVGTSILTLCQILTFDSWISGVVRPIIQTYPLAWIYFITYATIGASIIMNVITSIVVNSVINAHNDTSSEKN